MSDSRHAGNLPLLGGQLCLDFANTVDWRLGDDQHDWLSSYGDLVAWSRHTGILSWAQAGRLIKEAEASPAAGAAVLRQALALRELIYRVFSLIAHGHVPTNSDIEELNHTLSRSLARMRLVSTHDSFEWGWAEDGTRLERPLWHVVQSAAALLTAGKLDRVRQCADGLCGWLFFDMSKNRSRRWCSMEDCGNRAKARRHYEKTRALRKQRE
jgi:predicted RNA-binding Zn ribbon-like protein